ncbi:MAG: hypothetical protein ACKOAD_05915 [Gammaproteobacteria bacterium]
MTIFCYKTKLGDFFIYPISEDKPSADCVLAVGDEVLGRFQAISQAMSAVSKQETGYLQWDQVLHQDHYNFRNTQWKEWQGMETRETRH